MQTESCDIKTKFPNNVKRKCRNSTKFTKMKDSVRTKCSRQAEKFSHSSVYKVSAQHNLHGTC